MASFFTRPINVLLHKLCPSKRDRCHFLKHSLFNHSLVDLNVSIVSSFIGTIFMSRTKPCYKGIVNKPHQGRRLRRGQWGMVHSKSFGGGDGHAYIPKISEIFHKI